MLATTAGENLRLLLNLETTPTGHDIQEEAIRLRCDRAASQAKASAIYKVLGEASCIMQGRTDLKQLQRIKQG